MIAKEEAANYLPENGRVLITCKNGVITSLRVVHDNEHVTSLKALFELAKLAGYTITKNGDSEL